MGDWLTVLSLLVLTALALLAWWATRGTARAEPPSVEDYEDDRYNPDARRRA